MQWEWMGRWRM